MFDPAQIKQGDSLSSKAENEGNDEIRRIGSLRGSTGINVGTNGELCLDLPERIYIKLTSSANGNGGYSWKQVMPAPLGTWTDTTRTGSASADPCYERGTRLATLTAGNTVYEACRAETTGEWIFE